MPQLNASMRWVRGSNPVVVRSSAPNAGHEPRPEAGAQRTLEAVGSMPSVRLLPFVR
jgi:hypothetical protein